MEWAILGFVALVWLISPIILLIALIVARRQVRELRERPFARSIPESSDQPPPVPIAPVLGGGHYAPADLENLGEEVRKKVYQSSGITLEWEIMRVGEYPQD